MTATTPWLVDLDMHGIAERLKRLREERELTQTRLAELLGMAARSYNRWERGGHMPSLEMLIKAADVLQVSLDELVGRTESNGAPAIRNAELQQLVHEVDELPDREQQALIVVIDGLVKSVQVSRAVSRRTGTKRVSGRERR
jgi:transcriptional regulator with XRE-family HTH domain